MMAVRNNELSRLQPRSKAARLRALMPQIRAKLEEGVQHSDIIRLLNQQGLELTERTYQSYLYRLENSSGRTGSRGVALRQALWPRRHQQPCRACYLTQRQRTAR